jgi:hypothetical protein
MESSDHLSKENSNEHQLKVASFEFAHLLKPVDGGAIKTEATRFSNQLENTITRFDCSL